MLVSARGMKMNRKIVAGSILIGLGVGLYIWEVTRDVGPFLFGFGMGILLAGLQSTND